MEQDRPTTVQQALIAEESDLLGAIIDERDPEDFEILSALALEPDQTVSEAVRRRALYAVGRWGDARVVPALVQSLPHLTSLERLTAVDALGRLGGEEAENALADLADDPSEQVRKFVVRALQQIDTPSARAQLDTIAASETETDWIRSLAADR